MKRFYRQAAAVAGPGGHGVALDGRPLKTPAKQALRLPNAALAAALAEEWQQQGDEIRPAEMPLMQLVSTAIDRVAADPARLVDLLTGYGRADLLCYRAAHPADLAARQAECWQPWLDWAAERHFILFNVTVGVVPVDQPAASLAALRRVLAACDCWRLTALQSLVPALASTVLGLAVAEQALSAEAAFDLAHLDETFQAERWGQDAEAVRRLNGLRQEIAAAARFVALLTEA